MTLAHTAKFHLDSMEYYPYGEIRSDSVPMDKLFSGQRLDDTGLH